MSVLTSIVIDNVWKVYVLLCNTTQKLGEVTKVQEDKIIICFDENI